MILGLIDTRIDAEPLAGVHASPIFGLFKSAGSRLAVRRVLCAVSLACAALTLCRPVFSGEDRHFIDASKLPVNGAVMSDFVPMGWMIESVIQHDLDGDHKPDAVLTLIESLPTTIDKDTLPARSRALVVLLQTKTGGLHRVAVAKSLLRCSTCFGAMSGTEGGGADIKVAKRVIIVEELWGSRETVKTRLLFRYDSRSRRIALIGEDIERADRATGALLRKSRNLLTGIQMTEAKQYDEKWDRLGKMSTKKQRIAKTRRFIEDIDYEEYEK